MLTRSRVNGSKLTLGFSLVELLLVIAILGIITGVAIPSFLGQKKHARMVGDARANARIIQMALDARRAEIGIYGEAGTSYSYETSNNGTTYTRPDKDIIPSFSPQGNSRMSYHIEIGTGGLLYDLSVFEGTISGGKIVLTGNQTGDFKEVK